MYLCFFFSLNVCSILQLWVLYLNINFIRYISSQALLPHCGGLDIYSLLHIVASQCFFISHFLNFWLAFMNIRCRNYFPSFIWNYMKRVIFPLPSLIKPKSFIISSICRSVCLLFTMYGPTSLSNLKNIPFMCKKKNELGQHLDYAL